MSTKNDHPQTFDNAADAIRAAAARNRRRKRARETSPQHQDGPPAPWRGTPLVELSSRRHLPQLLPVPETLRQPPASYTAPPGFPASRPLSIVPPDMHPILMSSSNLDPTVPPFIPIAQQNRPSETLPTIYSQTLPILTEVVQETAHEVPNFPYHQSIINYMANDDAELTTMINNGLTWIQNTGPNTPEVFDWMKRVVAIHSVNHNNAIIALTNEQINLQQQAVQLNRKEAEQNARDAELAARGRIMLARDARLGAQDEALKEREEALNKRAEELEWSEEQVEGILHEANQKGIVIESAAVRQRILRDYEDN